MNKPGFSAIEFLVYLTISAVLMVVIFRFYNGAQTSFARLKESAFLFNALQNACDIVTTDIMAANSNKSQWHRDDNICVFQTAKQSIGWQLQKNQLYRIVGNFDFAHKKWRQRRRSLIAKQVASFFVKPEYVKDHVADVEISVTMRGTHQSAHKKSLAYLYNRVIA